MIAPHDATAEEMTEWDRRNVDGAGGHVYQSTVWAAQRERLGWEPRFVGLDGGSGALVLLRHQPWVGGSSAYVPRGPVHDPGADPLVAVARMAALADWLRGQGVDVVAMDPEIAVGPEITAAGAAVRDGLRNAGFRPIPEIQPSRHRVSLTLHADTDDGAVRASIAKGTRQRIAAAERDGIVIVRYDAAGWPGDHPLFARPTRPPGDALARFATLLEGTGERRGFRFGPRQVFIDWWLAAHAAGMLVHLEAREVAAAAVDGSAPSATDDVVLGGLILYRHGERLSTVHSADAPGARDRHPGVMHLLRWRAIQLALREGRTEMDLGGVDVGPYHREPLPGDPLAGLYEHKRSFGAHWVEMVGAHERVLRPWRASAGRVTARMARMVGR